MRGILLGAALLAAFTGGAQTLKLGDPAPNLPVAQWIKGQPVREFEQGKIYVVECWATWCGPCHQTIPHLTKLAEKFKDKVTIIGVSVWERASPNDPNAHIRTVEQFVERMGNQMNYTVAVDSVEGAVVKAWMEAANQDGIPTAFVIDQQKRVVWIGHPMERLDWVLSQVMEGEFDWKAAAELQRRQRKQQEPLQKDSATVTQLMQQGKPQDALRKLDAMISQYTEFPILKLVRFETLLCIDEKQAYTYALQLAQNDFKDEPLVLNTLAWTIAGGETNSLLKSPDLESMIPMCKQCLPQRPACPPLKSPDYAVAITIARRAVELTKEQDASILDTLAYAYFKNGDLQNALKYQKMALERAEKDAAMDATLKKEIRDRYEKFKKASPAK